MGLFKKRSGASKRKRDRRAYKLAKIKARGAKKKKVITARKSAKINRQNKRTQRVKARTSVRKKRVGAKERSGFYTAEASSARIGAIGGALGAAGSAFAGATPLGAALGAAGSSFGGDGYGDDMQGYDDGGAAETPPWLIPVVAIGALGAVYLITKKK